MSRATEAELLEQRIVPIRRRRKLTWRVGFLNECGGSPAIRFWNCAATPSGQTLPLLERVGRSGRVVALDISRKALDTLAAKATHAKQRLTLVESSLDSLSSSLQTLGLQPGLALISYSVRMVFTTAPTRKRTLARSPIVARSPMGESRWSVPSTPIINPYSILSASQRCRDSRSRLLSSSRRFMLQTVLPWGARNFASTAVHTMVNPVASVGDTWSG